MAPSECMCLCVCPHRWFTLRLSPPVGTPPPNAAVHPESRESEAKAAGQGGVLGSILVVIIWRNMRQLRRGRRRTDRHAGEEGAQTDRYPAEAVPGQTGGAGDKQTAAV